MDKTSQLVTIFRLILIVSILSLPEIGGAQSNEFDKGGFVLTKDQEGKIVEATYNHPAALRNQFRSGKILSSDIVSADKFKNFSTLEELTFPYGVSLDVEILKYLTKSTKLKKLTLGFVGVNSESVNIEGDVNKFALLKNLESAHLCIDKINDRHLKFVAALPRLQRLEFNAGGDGIGRRKSGCSDECATYIARASSLKHLWVHDAHHLTDLFIKRISDSLTGLSSLDIESPLFTDTSLQNIGGKLPNLKRLNLGSSQLTDNGVNFLKSLQKLEQLRIPNGNISCECIHSLIELDQLSELSLPIKSINDKNMSQLVKFQKLELLHMRYPRLSDSQFSELHGHPSLKSVFINGSQLTNKVALEVIKSMPNLSFIQIGENTSLQRQVNGYLRLKDSSSD